jgi:3'(2'), 5'-bisphosphate nucleotidase
VWIDPLDGTYSFCGGALDEVTVLIGLSYDGKAKLGVIGSPYTRSATDKVVF